MKKQVTPFEIVGIIASPVIAYFLYRFVRIWTYPILERTEGFTSVLAAILFVSALPAFAAVLAAAIIQSGRYKIVNASLATFVVVVMHVILGIRMISDFQSLIIFAVLVAGAMGSALAATQIWKAIGKAITRREKAAESAAGASGDVPKNSAFLSALAILSIPIVIANIVASAFVSIGIAAAVLFILFQLPRIPVYLIIGAGILPIAALWAMATSLVAIARGGRGSHAAIAISKSEVPELYSVADEVARLVGAKPADSILLHVFPTFFVTQGKADLLDGKASGRMLALGMPLVGDLCGREMRAVLAHEFAHFAKGDLAYSSVVAPAYRALGTALEKLSNSNPGGNTGAFMSILRAPSLFFLANSYEYFATIDRMLQRGREFRADRAAADLYGKESMVSALEKVSVRSEIFGKVSGSIKPEREETFFTELRAAIDSRMEASDEILSSLREAGEDALDTHPSISARAARLPDIPGSVSPAETESFPSLGKEGSRLSSTAVRRLGIELAVAK